jgi:hypothetical protein
MKETGILFTPENYTKCLDGSKPMTRRLNGLDEINKAPDEWAVMAHAAQWPWWSFAHKTKTASRGGGIVEITCPYGTIGDRLYVKEAWATTKGLDHVKPRDLSAGFACEYKNRGTSLSGVENLQARGKWRPSLFMPRLAARLWLELTEVRVERLQDISYEDCLAEGIEVSDLLTRYEPREKYAPLAINLFRHLWESINGPGSWAMNPWVWVLGYRKVRP